MTSEADYNTVSTCSKLNNKMSATGVDWLESWCSAVCYRWTNMTIWWSVDSDLPWIPGTEKFCRSRHYNEL